jgi:hypothetical protein
MDHVHFSHRGRSRTAFLVCQPLKKLVPANEEAGPNLEAESGGGSGSSSLDVVVSLYRHVLPGVPRKFLRNHLTKCGVHTYLLLSNEDRPDCDPSATDASSVEATELDCDSSTKDSPEHTDFCFSDTDDDDILDRNLGESCSERSSNDRSDCSSSDDDLLMYDQIKAVEGEDAFLPHKDLVSHILGNGSADSGASSSANYVFERIIGAITFQVLEEVSPKRVTIGSDAGSNRALCIDLVGIRPRFQGLGMGKFMVKYLQAGNISPEGPFSAVLAFPDDRSIGFFQTCEFDADPILNSHFLSRSDAHRVWKNSTQVCYMMPSNKGGSQQVLDDRCHDIGTPKRR